MIITAASVANEIRMKRTQFAGAFVLAEGPTDARFYKRFVEPQSCQVVNAQNRDNALNAHAILAAANVAGAVAMVDADFSVLNEDPHPGDGVLYTDGHDLEMMILRSPALENVLGELGSEDKVAEVTGGRELRDVLLTLGQPLGALRWLSNREQLALKFEGLGFGKFLDRTRLTLDLSLLVQELRNHSRAFHVPDTYLRNSVEELLSRSPDPRQVACGHDIAEIVSFGLRRALGSRREGEVTSESIRMNLRIAYEMEHFRSSQLYAQVRAWEAAHPPFRILR